MTCNQGKKVNRNSLTVDAHVGITIKDFTIIMLVILKDLVEKLKIHVNRW